MRNLSLRRRIDLLFDSKKTNKDALNLVSHFPKWLHNGGIGQGIQDKKFIQSWAFMGRFNQMRCFGVLQLGKQLWRAFFVKKTTR